jgi:hypothetical protein
MSRTLAGVENHVSAVNPCYNGLVLMLTPVNSQYLKVFPLHDGLEERPRQNMLSGGLQL